MLEKLEKQKLVNSQKVVKAVQGKFINIFDRKQN